jgi:TolB protein
MQAAAKTIAEVLWDDLDFENEFYLIGHAEAAKIRAAATSEDLPYDDWTNLGADGVILGSVKPNGGGIEVNIRLIGIRGDFARKQLFGKVYNGCTLKNPRYCAHFIADDFHKDQRGLDGVARTRLAFSSDRNNELVAGRFTGNLGKEIYIADYDGASPQRITVNKSINISPSWAPDGRSIAYTSYSSHFPDVYVQNLAEIRLSRPANGTDLIQNSLATWSPDGSKLAFTSSRDGHLEIYVVNRDGTNLRRLTNNALDNLAPSWSPTGAQIVFVSGRSGDAQLYMMGADGTDLQRLNCGEPHCDHPSWSSTLNKIAYTCGTNASGYDVCLLDMATRQILKLTDGQGTNEQPSFAPNGRHVVFVTTRWGKQQLAMVDLRGNVLKRRITEVGNNTYPSWSRTPQ